MRPKILLLIAAALLAGCSGMPLKFTNLQSPQATAAKGVATYGIVKLLKGESHDRAAKDVAIVRAIGDPVYQLLGGAGDAGITVDALRKAVDDQLAKMDLKAEDVALVQSVRPLVDMYVESLLAKAGATGAASLTAEQVGALRQAMREFDSTFTIMGYPR